MLVWSLVFDHFNLFGYWCFEFGAFYELPLDIFLAILDTIPVTRKVRI